MEEDGNNYTTESKYRSTRAVMLAMVHNKMCKKYSFTLSVVEESSEPFAIPQNSFGRSVTFPLHEDQRRQLVVLKQLIV
jgi:hypothetical protein